ncbi:hypothetical protein AAFF_G00227730 [Aldrovandia affinis]|uniref:Uncharacterized protein n=1 Tax=Aldrovandia affinis TaxID=143900 RepID=A0AAD7X2J2_9TELE|nr:hypothetical protein AAFF_G00227730 [Aldrovandia affinis]
MSYLVALPGTWPYIMTLDKLPWASTPESKVIVPGCGGGRRRRRQMSQARANSPERRRDCLSRREARSQGIK